MKSNQIFVAISSFTIASAGPIIICSPLHSLLCFVHRCLEPVLGERGLDMPATLDNTRNKTFLFYGLPSLLIGRGCFTIGLWDAPKSTSKYKYKYKQKDLYFVYFFQIFSFNSSHPPLSNTILNQCCITIQSSIKN